MKQVRKDRCITLEQETALRTEILWLEKENKKREVKIEKADKHFEELRRDAMAAFGDVPGGIEGMIVKIRKENERINAKVRTLQDENEKLKARNAELQDKEKLILEAALDKERGARTMAEASLSSMRKHCECQAVALCEIARIVDTHHRRSCAEGNREGNQ